MSRYPEPRLRRWERVTEWPLAAVAVAFLATTAHLNELQSAVRALRRDLAESARSEGVPR